MPPRRARKPARTQAKPAPLSFSSAALLVAILALPAFFNIQSSTSFEPDKGALLRTAALLILLGLAPGWMQALRSGEMRPRLVALPLPCRFLLAALGLSLLATLFGVDPVTSFWGNHERGYGLLTLLSGGLILAAAWQHARNAGPWLLIDAILLSAAIPALYGLAQVIGFDPVRGQTVSFVLGQRASSSLGNPLFLGDFLLLALILGLARLLAGPALRARPRAGLVAYLGLLFLALAATQSRSAYLGLIAAVVVFLLFWGQQRRQRRFQIGAFAALTAGLLLLLLAWAAPQLLPARLSDLFASGGTGGQRLLIWQAVLDLLRHEPRFLLLGLGPDALPFKIAPYLPAALAHFEVDWAFRLPDRAHTFPLELIAQSGSPGLLLWTGFWAALAARLLPASRRRRALALQLGGAAALAALAALLAGSASAPLGWTAGLLVGLILALLISPPADSANAAPPLAAFLLAALAGRWLLLGFSFPTHAPDLLFWTLAGLILAQTPATAAPAPVDLPLLHLAGIALALFGFSLSASGGASILLWLAALILLLAAAHVLARNDHEIRRTWHTLILPPLTLLPAIPLNRSAGLSAELAYGWLLLWLAGQAIWLIAPPARRRLTPALLATLPVLALLNLPVFGDIAYKTAILSPNDATARSAAMRRAFTLSPHDHVLAAGIVPTENLSLPADATLDPPQARRITGLYDRALAAQPLAPETAAAYAEWLRQRAAVDAAAHAPALDMFTRALALSPNDIQTRNRQALLLADQAALRALIDLDPLYGPAYLHLATLQQQNGDLAAARSTLQTGIANVPWWDALPRALAALP